MLKTPLHMRGNGRNVFRAIAEIVGNSVLKPSEFINIFVCVKLKQATQKEKFKARHSNTV